MSRKYFLMFLVMWFLSFSALAPSALAPVFAQNTPPQGRNFPGSPFATPQGKRWVPGHFEVKDGRQIWIRGHYESTGENQPMAPFAAPSTSEPVQQRNAGPERSEEGFIRPFTESKESTKKWVPGHFEEVDGRKVWVRGHYANQEGTVAGPPAGSFNPPANDQKALVASKRQAGSSNIVAQGWAVVVGISKYKNAAGAFPEVRYAASDAKAFYDFLRSPKGGGFSPDHILFLQNENATLENIKYAFFDFLKQAIEEDFVVVYFSGHGTPEKDNPQNLYLVAYDSRPDRIASTAFPMWDIETALSRYIKSEKIIMFADACHSAGIASDITVRNIATKNNLVSKYLLEVAKANKGRAIFTASEAGELSQESKKWGGGHGVFTYFLIRGLNGEADVNDNRIVTLGEVIDFVSENVRRATNNTQHPDTAGIFDREFPVAILPH
jgi:hypothetical protein